MVTSGPWYQLRWPEHPDLAVRVIILSDARGLDPLYEQLAERFAQAALREIDPPSKVQVADFDEWRFC